MILAIDPGNTESAYVVLESDYTLRSKGKVSNADMLDVIRRYIPACRKVIIERIASYGMAVGRTVFETCEWVGRFTQQAEELGATVEYIYRLEEKMAICHDQKANDATIRRALIDRFAKHDFRTGRGTKNNPDYFYGFAADTWAAMAVAVTYYARKELYESGRGREYGAGNVARTSAQG